MGQAFEYKYRTGYVSKVSAAVAGPICQKLHDAKVLTPENLVEEARPEESPLHAGFEWNDSVAAEKWRHEQARLMIANLVLVESDVQTERQLTLVPKEETEEEFQDEIDEDSVAEYQDRAFVSTGEKNHRYVPILSALTNDDWKANLLKFAKRDMISFINKYRRLTELDTIINDMNDFLGA